MRLTAIKLAGFKSFVDPTTFRAPTNLTGIVGPNGCGKSNIIDAVRWVMGEGSARVLRGELMSDVIFSGSSTRKPVGTASVELLFDNSDGQIGGEFAAYAEISVKRVVGRDGISVYTLNGTRCRRKDVRDLFLGTGLGSKSYSIIEQGMISQVVDARPDEIRAHLEEAAGISKYKERRRETESRIAHTRENLDRLADLREEVGNHLARLKRQARAAERYRKLKQQQRDLETRLLALRWRDEVARADAGRAGLRGQETALEERRAAQRAAEAGLEELHQQQAQANEAFSEVQAELYAVTSDIARLEQSIQHGRELQSLQRKEHEEVGQALAELEQHMALDRAQMEDFTGRLAELTPALEEAQAEDTAAEADLQAVEAEVQAWQSRLETHHQGSAERNRVADGLRARVEVLDQRIAAAAQRMEELRSETADADPEPLDQAQRELQRRCKSAAAAEAGKQGELDDARNRLTELQEALRASSAEEAQQRRELQALEARLATLNALQAAAESQGQAREWITGQGLGDAPRLVTQLRTESGWEPAVEQVLGHWLDALMVTDLAGHAAAVGALEGAGLGMLQDRSGGVRPRSGSLAEKVKGPDPVIAMLNRVRVAEDLASAIELLDEFDQEESAITRAGEWVGPGWVRVAGRAASGAGALERQQEIETLTKQADDLRAHCAKLESGNESAREARHALEVEVTRLQDEANGLHRQRAELEAELGGAQGRIDDLTQRGERLGRELQQLEEAQQADAAALAETRGELEQVLESMAGLEAERAELEQQRTPLLERRTQARTVAASAREKRHELAVRAGSNQASLDSLTQSLGRMDTQIAQLQQRRETLAGLIAEAEDPAAGVQGEMDGLLARRVEVEQKQAEARRGIQALEETYRELDATRQESVQAVEAVRQELEHTRLQQQELELNARTLRRQTEALGAEIEAVAGSIPEDADAGQWEEDIERLGTRISRLEPVNLAAIQEYEEELKRKEYLDAQNEDLIEALTTLEGAIARIDRQTRTRFKDTFERVNKGMQELFPRLFGGGHGYLELTGEDLLTTGVGIMGRPPGKRVSSIHLLSGGEKALTAVAFVFAIFRLNPAPFCLLDEVDAPLDDANVGRFSALVREMAENVQFIIVTHNKITMEMVHQLSGVTMREPGVSRLVQVDIDEAARLAAS